VQMMCLIVSPCIGAAKCLVFNGFLLFLCQVKIISKKALTGVGGSVILGALKVSSPRQ